MAPLLFIPSPASLFAQGGFTDGGPWHFDGFSLNVRPLFSKGATDVWRAAVVEVTNTSGRTLELDLRITSTPEDHPREHRWSTVVAAGEDGGERVQSQVVPIYCQTENAWSTYTQGRVEVRRDGDVVNPLDESELRFTLTGEARGQIRQMMNNSSRWRFIGSHNTLCVRQGIEAIPRGFKDAYLEAVDDRIEGNGQNTGDAEWSETGLEALPLRPEAYEVIHRVILFGFGPDRLTEPQREALRSAVQLGLEVWVVVGRGGEGLTWFGSSVTNEQRSYTADDGTARKYFYSDGDPGTVIEAVSVPGGVGTPRTDIPVLLRYPEGAGSWVRTTHFAEPFLFDVPIREDWGRIALYRPILDQDLRQSFRGRGTRSGEGRQLVEEIDRLYRRSVDAEALFIFVIIYLLVAGPGLFVFLKRKGRLPWLLWLQPTVVALFLVGTGLIGWAKFGVANRTDHTFVLFQKEGEAGGVLVHFRSVYSSVSGTRDVIPLAGESLPIPVPDAARRRAVEWDVGTEEPRLEDYPARFWSLRHFSNGRGVDLGAVTLQRKPGDAGALDGILLENRLPFVLHGISVGLGQNTFQGDVVGSGEIGLLAPLSLASPFSGSRLGGAMEAAGGERVRAQLGRWPNESGYDVRATAEFDPAQLGEIVGSEGRNARGFYVLLSEDGRR